MSSIVNVTQRSWAILVYFVELYLYNLWEWNISLSHIKVDIVIIYVYTVMFK